MLYDMHIAMDRTTHYKTLAYVALEKLLADRIFYLFIL